MKSTYGILWYFFIIYATSVIVNFSHYHKTLGDESGESMILSAAKCLMHGRSEDPANGQDTCKLSFQYKKETVLYFLKNLLSRKEFKQAYKLTVKSGSKKGAGDLVNITLDLKPLFAEKNSPNSEKLNFWHSFYIFVSIILITLIAPLYPLTNYIYLITLASMFILSLSIYLQLIKLIVFGLIYLLTLGKYKFWLLPNLSKDVGILGTFWPLYELKSNRPDGGNDGANSLNNSNNEPASGGNPKSEETLNSGDQRSNESIDNKSAEDGPNDSNQTGSADSSKGVSNVNSKQAPVETGLNSTDCRLTNLSESVTEFEGNDRLPTITTTPPPPANNSIDLVNSRMLFGRPTGLEVIDLNNSEQEERSGGEEDEADRHANLPGALENERSAVKPNGGQFEEHRSGSLDDYANISPVISYLNVNEVKKRKRFASNRSDDGFEILSDDFLNSPPIIVNQNQSSALFLAKQSLL